MELKIICLKKIKNKKKLLTKGAFIWTKYSKNSNLVKSLQFKITFLF